MLERLPMNMIFKKFPAAALIDGEWIISAKTFSVTDPATGAEVATVPDLGAKEAVLAIDAAARALPLWSAKTAKERAAILRRWFDLITAETESLAQLMTTEQGKPLAEARAEVAYGASPRRASALTGAPSRRPPLPSATSPSSSRSASSPRSRRGIFPSP
jgi:acyl-CoA reductase-like NAD-dependent aldehyde dehydrogenase